MEATIVDITKADFINNCESYLQLVDEKIIHIPEKLAYSIKRFQQLSGWKFDDKALFSYQNGTDKRSEKKIEIRFCVQGNAYCTEEQEICTNCEPTKKHLQQISTFDVFTLVINPSFLQSFGDITNTSYNFSTQVISFQLATSFNKEITVCHNIKGILNSILKTNYENSLLEIFITAQTQMLLLKCVELVEALQTNVLFTCKFLSNRDDLEKITQAKNILHDQIGTPITIKELSKKVAMNECYLKKGFKEVFGTTIFEYYQNCRMEHAKELLYNKGLTVTDVSILLGYSSISHFSTAFKKHTGLKPCELLLK